MAGTDDAGASPIGGVADDPIDEIDVGGRPIGAAAGAPMGPIDVAGRPIGAAFEAAPIGAGDAAPTGLPGAAPEGGLDELAARGGVEAAGT